MSESSLTSGQARLDRAFSDVRELSRQALELGTISSSPVTANDVLRLVGHRLQRSDHLNRRWAALLLLSGSICGVFAFLLASFVGLKGSTTNYSNHFACFIDQPCASGRDYHCETVSEMVSKPGEPSTKLFYSLTVIASICLIVSRYPWELKNVYVQNSSAPMLAVLPALRAVVPPLGMLIVAMVPVVPRAERTNAAIKLVCEVHTLGAVMFVAGYNALEAFVLRKLWARLDQTEKRLRFLCVIGSSACMVTFVLAGAIYANIDKLGLCCTDEYIDSVEGFMLRYDVHWAINSTEYKAQSELIRHIYGQKILKNSAHGLALTVKKTEFWAEEFAGLWIILSHIVIWFFCEERTIHVPPVF